LICKAGNIPHELIDWNEVKMFNDPKAVEAEIVKSKATHLAMVHSETTSGTINDIEKFAAYYKKNHNMTILIDAVSSFGAYPISMENIDFLVSSSNKNIEAMPGFSFIIANKKSLQACKGNATTLSLDIFAQREALDKTGQFRFTPPTHALLAFRQALDEFEQEGGVTGR